MAEPLYIAICEDDPADREKLVRLLEGCAIPSVPTLFSSGEALLDAYRPQQFDLLLSDIYLGGITGVETVTRLRTLDRDLPVAFVTTSTDHALEGYRLSVLKYIEKPFRQQDLEEILALARMKRDSAPVLTIRPSGQEETIRLSRITYLEQQLHHVRIHLTDGSVLELRERLSALWPQLEGSDFFRSHKSFCVNLSAVQSIDGTLRCFVLQNGEKVPIRRESLSQARQALKDHLFSQTWTDQT